MGVLADLRHGRGLVPHGAQDQGQGLEQGVQEDVVGGLEQGGVEGQIGVRGGGDVTAGVPVDLEQVETNFVQVDVGALDLDASDALARLSREGIGFSMTPQRGVLRAVTHLDIGDDDIEQAIERVPRALGVLA